jgi:hypothetical protein
MRNLWKSVQLEYLADLRLVQGVFVFKLHFPTSWTGVLIRGALRAYVMEGGVRQHFPCNSNF